MASYLEKHAVYAALFVGMLFTLYSALTFNFFLLPYQWLLVFIMATLTGGGYLLLKRGIPRRNGAKIGMVVILYAIAAGIIFHSTTQHVFRQEEWTIYVLFSRIGAFSFNDLKDISLFALFGHIRFQPFANLLLYSRYLILDNNVMLYHLLNILMHVGVSVLIFLILHNYTKDIPFSYLCGLFFIALPSQFDTVVWTYHIYIIAGTLFFLFAILLTHRSAETGSRGFMVASVVLAASSAFLYEPAVVCHAALFFIMLGMRQAQAESISRRDYFFICVAIAAAYLLYAGITAYGISLAKSSHRMSLSDLLSVGNVLKSLEAVATDLWRSAIIKNSGVHLNILIEDVVSASLPKSILADIMMPFKILIALFLFSFCRFTKRNAVLVLTLVSVALSYLFIIALGRMEHGGNLFYFLTQPRYQYFPNAVLLLSVCMLLWSKYQMGFTRLIAAIMFTFFLLNSQSTMAANNKVGLALGPMQDHYVKIKDFLASNPSEIVFLDFIPDDQYFKLGKELYLDVLLEGKTTKFINRATYVYDGKNIIQNDLYDKDEGLALSDFTIEWAQVYFGDTEAVKSLEVVGADGIYPRISLSRNGLIDVALQDTATDEINVVSFQLPFSSNADSGRNSVIVEKSGGNLCVYFNGKMLDKVLLNSSYKTWEKDGTELLGDYYRKYEGISVSNVLIRLNSTRYGCSKDL